MSWSGRAKDPVESLRVSEYSASATYPLLCIFFFFVLGGVWIRTVKRALIAGLRLPSGSDFEPLFYRSGTKKPAVMLSTLLDK